MPLYTHTTGPGWLVVCESFVLATSKVISEKVPICDHAHTRWLHSVALLGIQATGTMTSYIPLTHIILTLSQPVFALCY